MSSATFGSSTAIKDRREQQREDARKKRRVAPERRKRAERACTFCKKRKKKCDGQQPCELCFQRGISCIYEKKAYGNDIGYSEANAPAMVGGTATVTNASTDSHNTHSHATFHQHAHGPSINTNTNSTNVDQHVNQQEGSYAPHCSGESPGYKLEDKRESSRLLVNPEGRLHFIGESSTLSLLEQARQLFSKVLGPSRFSQDPKRFNIVDGSPNKVAQHPVQLPARQTAQKLLLLYEENVATYIYAVDVEEIQNVLAQVYNDPISAPKSSLCILHLIFAIGAVFLRISVPDSLDPNIFFESALGFLDESVVDVGEIWVVEAYLLSSLYDELQCKRNSSWVELGKAVRYAQGLGMHRPSADRKLPYKVRAHRRHLWRSLYVLDSLKSVNLGRPTMVGPYLQAGTEDLQSQEIDKSQIVMHKFCELMTILNDIATDVYGVESVSSTQAQSLIKRLQDWSAKLDDQSGKSEETDNVNTHSGKRGPLGRSWPLKCTEVAKLMLSTSYLNAIILLTRPFLFYEVAWKTEGKSADAALVTFERLARACIQSAMTLVTLASQHFHGGSARLAKPSTIIGYIFTCGVVLHLEKLKAIACGQPVAPSVSWAIMTCMQILVYHSKWDLSATRFHGILVDLDASTAGTSQASSVDLPPIVGQHHHQQQMSQQVQPVNDLAPPDSPAKFVPFSNGQFPRTASDHSSNGYSPNSDSYFNINSLTIDNSTANNQWSFTSLGPVMNDFVDNSSQPYAEFLLSNFSPMDATLMNTDI